MTKIQSTNIQAVYVIPYKRPYVIPQKRTAQEQKVMDVINFGHYLENKENR